jgi:hypothetical protein
MEPLPFGVVESDAFAGNAMMREPFDKPISCTLMLVFGMWESVMDAITPMART